MNQLGKELAKLDQLAPKPVDLSFLIGYLAYPLSHEAIPNFRPALKDVINYRDESLITSQNVLELIVVLKYKILNSEPKRLITSIEHYAGELICDNKYLYNRFFEEKIELQKKKSGLGIECTICTLEIDAATICYLSCNHMYHKECFKEYSKEQIAKKSIPLKCPTEDCGLELANEEIREFLSKDLRDKYEEFMFQNYVQQHMDDTSWCPTPGCKAVFAFDQELDNYRCPSCRKHYCLRCKCQMHVGVTCKEYQELGDMSETDKKFMVLVKGAKYKQCPNCKFWVEKNEGCDHMTCRCKYQFCYICGGKYGACSCVGVPRIGLRPMPVPPRPPGPNLDILYDPPPRHRPMPFLINPRAPLPPPPRHPHLIPLRPPLDQSYEMQQYLSDEDFPQEIYNSVSEQINKQEQQFKAILKHIEEMSLAESKLNKEKEGQVKQQKKQQIKRQLKQQIKQQVKNEKQQDVKINDHPLISFFYSKPNPPKSQQ